MQKTDDLSKEPLSNGGLQILTELITHQDSVTWTAFSVFAAAEFLLLAIYIQAIPAFNYSVIGTLGAFGLATTFVSFFILERSNRYLEAYVKLAKQRCHPQDSEIFDVQVRSIELFRRKVPLPATSKMLRYMHTFFLILWIALFLGYLLILAFRLSAGHV